MDCNLIISRKYLGKYRMAQKYNNQDKESELIKCNIFQALKIALML